MTRLEIVSDVVCPWCYLGAANLMRAVAAQDAHPFAFAWRPFQLDPTIPREGMDRTEYLARKFGDLSRLEESHRRLAEMGREVGIDFRFERIRRSLGRFRGVDRRFQWKGEALGARVVDDYGHHPAEIQATLTAARVTRWRTARIARC